MAQHGSSHWQQARTAWQIKAREQHTQAAAATAASSRKLLLSADELLLALEVVHPVEESEPLGLRADIRLRPYQKQSLAFALEIETSTEAVLAGRDATVRGGFICDEMGMGKTAVVTSLILARPSPQRTPESASRALVPFQASLSSLVVKPEASGSSGASSSEPRVLRGHRVSSRERDAEAPKMTREKGWHHPAVS